jgi:hypothetical protein
MNTPAEEDPFDTQLRQWLGAEPEPADEGFSLAVMAAVQAHELRQTHRVPELQHAARWFKRAQHARCLSIAAGCVAVVGVSTQASAAYDPAHQAALLALLGLLAYWCWPSRFSRA